MNEYVYRYEISKEITPDEIESLLQLALLACSSLHGESRTRLDAGYSFDQERRSLVIDASTAVGQSLNQVFIGLLQKEIDPEDFTVERIHKSAASLRPSSN